MPLDGQTLDRPGAAVPVSCPRSAVQAGRWSTRPCIGAPVHSCGSAPRPRFPGSGCLVPVCNLSDIAPDRAILNPVFFLVWCIFELRNIWKLKSSFSGRFRYWLNCREKGKGGAVLFGRNRAERSTCGAASFVLQSGGIYRHQYNKKAMQRHPRLTNGSTG